MSKKADIFYGKVLLFGEYSILFNSKGLTIPYTHFTGQLSFINDDKYTDYEFALQSNVQLKDFRDFMLELEAKAGMPCDIDFKRLSNDIEKGLYFESNIPQGYGIGSSGALVASIYDRYCTNKIEANESISGENISKLREIFSMLESLFHGKSSGKIVSDHKRCLSFGLKSLHEVADVVDSYRIEPGSRLIKKDIVRIGRQGPGNGDALLHAA